MSDYPSDWGSRRKKVYKRDGHQCQNCGIFGGQKGTAELHAHHIVPKSKNGTHKLSNLVCMCKGCHNAIHGNRMAPESGTKAQTQAQETGKDSTFKVSNFKPGAQDTIRVFNAVVRLSNQTTDFASTIRELQNCVNQCAKSKEKMANVPEVLQRQYRRKHEDTKQDLDDMRVLIYELQQVLDQYATDSVSDDGQVLLNAYQEYTRMGDEYFEALRGVVSISDEDEVVVHSVRKDAEYDVVLRAIVQEFEEVVADTNAAMDKSGESIVTEAKKHY